MSPNTLFWRGPDTSSATTHPMSAIQIIHQMPSVFNLHLGLIALILIPGAWFPSLLLHCLSPATD